MRNRKIIILIVIVLCLFLNGCVTILDYEYSENYKLGPAIITDNVKNVNIEWLSGSVKVLNTEQSNLYFEEIADITLDEKNMVHYYYTNQTLHIKYAKSGFVNTKYLKKNLIVYIPSLTSLSNLEIESVSADVSVNGISGIDLNIETVSGKINIKDVGFQHNLELESVSGDISINSCCDINSLEIDCISSDVVLALQFVSNLDIETTSGKIDLRMTNFTSTEIETISGNVIIALPENLLFGFKINTLSNIIDNYGLLKSDNNYTSHDTIINGKIDSTSGTIEINKYTK